MKIHEIIPEFSPKIAVCDFDRAPRNVFSHYFPEVNIIGLGSILPKQSGRERNS